jgi:endoglucanase
MLKKSTYFILSIIFLFLFRQEFLRLTVPSVSAQTTCPLNNKGDANCDGVVNNMDYDLWRAVIRNDTVQPTGTKDADFDNNGRTTVSDFEIWRKYIFPTLPPGSGYTVASGKVFKNGTEIRLKGINWFGAEGNDHVVHGLWTREWKSMIAQMKTLGFNAVRLPFCPDTIRGTSVSSIDYSKNPDLAGLNSVQIFDKVVDELNRQQMYILLDHHTYDCNKIGGALPEVWYAGPDRLSGPYTETNWINDLKLVANRYKNREYVMGIDLKNEPHKNADGSYGAHWSAGNLDNDWDKAAERAGKAILQDAPNILIFIEGIGNYQPTSALPACNLPAGEYVFWGENLAYVACAPINTCELPLNKIVFSPHVYGPDVNTMSYFNDTTFPNNMPAIWDRHFGYLTAHGFTLIPGEWGGKYDQHAVGSQPRKWQDAMVNYFKTKHICNSFHWSWNPNSGDTGGILQDDWQTPWPQKMQLLNDYYGSCN